MIREAQGGGGRGSCITMLFCRIHNEYIFCSYIISIFIWELILVAILQIMNIQLWIKIFLKEICWKILFLECQKWLYIVTEIWQHLVDTWLPQKKQKCPDIWFCPSSFRTFCHVAYMLWAFLTKLMPFILCHYLYIFCHFQNWSLLQVLLLDQKIPSFVQSFATSPQMALFHMKRLCPPRPLN